MSRPVVVLLVCLVTVLIPGGVRIFGDEVLIEVEDAYIRADDGTWTIGNPLVRFTIGGNGGPAGIREIVEPASGADWHRSDEADSVVTINGQRLAIGTGMTSDGSDVTEWWGGVRLDVHYRLASGGVRLTRSYACYPGSSVIESWTTIRAESGTTTVSDLNGFAFSIPAGTLNWVTGHSASDDVGGRFTRANSELEDGQTFELGSDGRASERDLPWFTIKRGEAEFFGSLLWSGSWRFRTDRRGDNMAVQIGLPSFSTTIPAGGSLETPHAIFGLTSAKVPDTAIALRAFVDLGLRHGRTLKPFVSYNTWYSYGTFMDEASLLAEMEAAASTGVEQFVVDAGWWFHINGEDQGDYKTSWGNWQVDPERFPNGLGVLSDRAHELGMRFGVWVEPERVDRDTVGQPGLARERFLATSDGRYDPGQANSVAGSGQVCLADSEAYQWVLQRLVEFIEAARPDYVKWDNNFWVNCNRPGHGHGSGDGNFRHHLALDTMFGALRDRFPDLDIENCATGGNRLSLGMLRYTESAWLDDRTDPSTHVRHNIQGLTGIFPSAYLLTFALSTEAEPVMDGPEYDVSNIIRSRMNGAFGFSWAYRDMSEGVRASLRREVDLFKLIRPILQAGSAVLLGDQVPASHGAPAGWDVIQHLEPKTGQAVVMAFDTRNGPESTLVRPRGLRADAMYAVESADFGPLGEASGTDLMAFGLEVRASSLSRAHVLILRPLGPR